jgi:hypothetical protein
MWIKTTSALLSTDDDITNEKFRPADFVDDTDMEQAKTAMQCR